VEAASGKKLDAYLHDHMFAPLALTDTGCQDHGQHAKRLGVIHARGEDGTLAAIPFEARAESGIHMAAAGCTLPRPTTPSLPDILTRAKATATIS